MSGADPGFPNRGGAKDYVHVAHMEILHGLTSVKPELSYGRGAGPA